MAVKTIPVLFGLAFDVRRANNKSGFQPSKFDSGGQLELFGDLRLWGFAAALKLGIAESMVLAGGDEKEYAGETPIVNRAESIRAMLIYDFGIDEQRVQAYPSRSNTGGNVEIIKRVLEERRLAPEDCGLSTNLYHLPRAHMDLMANGLSALPMYAAEAFWLLEDPDRKDDLPHFLGEGPLADRVTGEIQGVADKIRGTYVPRTDVAAINIEKIARSPA